MSSPHPQPGHAYDRCDSGVLRYPTLAERIALKLMDDERARHTSRTVEPSRPRRFSWETPQ